MSRKPDDATILTSWTNGRKAAVHLLQNDRGQRWVLKVYRAGFFVPMFREYLATSYVARRLPMVPKVLGFWPCRKELLLSYVSGDRVLEWVLKRFGDDDIVLSEFQSFHGLETNPRVARAFARFRQSPAEEVRRLKEAIRESYSRLHGIKILHGGPDPRNIIYEGRRAFLIDFDHARPSFAPEGIEYRTLESWYGIRPAGRVDQLVARAALS